MEFSYDYGNDYYDDFGDSFGDLFTDPDVIAVISMIIGFVAIFFIIGAAISLTLYILRSIGLYRLSVNRGMGGEALAWIPFVGYYRIGSVADDIAARTGSKSYLRYVLLAGAITNIIFSIVQNAVFLPRLSQILDDPYSFGYYGSAYGYSAFSGVSSLFSMFSLAVYVITIIALNKVYKCYRPMSSTSWTVLSVIFPFMQSIFLFAIRNSAPADTWAAPAGYYPAQPQGWQQQPQQQYPPYRQQPPMDYGYYTPPEETVQQGQPQQYMPPPPPPAAEPTYQPPAAPNPPEPWEIKDTSFEPPPQAPWENKDN